MLSVKYNLLFIGKRSFEFCFTLIVLYPTCALHVGLDICGLHYTLLGFLCKLSPLYVSMSGYCKLHVRMRIDYYWSAFDGNI